MELELFGDLPRRGACWSREVAFDGRRWKVRTARDSIGRLWGMICCCLHIRWDLQGLPRNSVFYRMAEKHIESMDLLYIRVSPKARNIDILLPSTSFNKIDRFPQIANCPRWREKLRAVQLQEEEVLFDAA